MGRKHNEIVMIHKTPGVPNVSSKLCVFFGENRSTKLSYQINLNMNLAFLSSSFYTSFFSVNKMYH